MVITLLKRGYDLLWEREQLENASVSDSANKKLFWKRLWKMNVPSKIKNFLWRACSEALPTRSNLAKRKVLDDPTCQLYGSEHENTMQCFMELQKHSNGLGSEIWVVEKRFPHGGVIFGLGITSWRSLKAARALCFCCLVNLV